MNTEIEQMTAVKKDENKRVPKRKKGGGFIFCVRGHQHNGRLSGGVTSCEETGDANKTT